MSITNKLSIFFLALSGILITIVSMFFSIKGFLLFIPDHELYLGLLGLGIAFELGKITASTFLFHKNSDNEFPRLFKVVMTISVIALVFFSALFTFVHLNASASKSLATNNTGNEKIATIEERNKVINERIKNIDDQINAIDPSYTRAKIRLYNSLNPEKEKLQLELDSNFKAIQESKSSNIESDQFIFLETLTKFTGIEKDKIFFYVTLFIVIIIDPLAISLFLCATYIYKQSRETETVQEVSPIMGLYNLNPIKQDNLELQEVLEEAIDVTKDNSVDEVEEEILPERTTKDILDEFLSKQNTEELHHSIIQK